MELNDILNDKRTLLEKRRVCPIREQYQTCLDLYLKYKLSSLGLEPINSLPKELDNIGIKLGYHDMHDLKGKFKRIELDALNESTRKGGNQIPNKKMNALINSFSSDQWIYFDSNFNTCFLNDLDTREEPLNYFEHYYGDYHKDFIPTKMKEAGDIYKVTFIDNRSFWYWLLATEGREFLRSLPKVEMARLNMDMTLMDNWGHFQNLGPSID
jgi:hypothetical protein